MSDRTCLTCAWWEKDIEPKRGEDGEDEGTCRVHGPSGCFTEAPFPITLEHDWCRHHATTRGWEDDVVASMKRHDKILALQAEIASLKARCEEATRLLADAVPVFKEESESYADWEVNRSQWLEGSEDA